MTRRGKLEHDTNTKETEILPFWGDRDIEYVPFFQMTRGSGKFKTKRGGGRNFSRNLQLDENGTAYAVDKWSARDKDKDESGDEEDESEEEESEEDSEDENAAPSIPGQSELTRSERKAAKKNADPKKKNKQEDGEEGSDDSDLVNPNRLTVKSKKLSDLNAPEPLSRREREAKEKQEAKDRYWKAHLAGKTDQAKADLARLASIRKEREEAQARRKAEAEAKAAEIEAKVKAQGRKV